MSLRSPRQGTAAALASVVLLAGCGGGGSMGSGGGQGAAPAAASVSIAGFKFAPRTVRVATGGTVTFTNADRASHTATAVQGAPASFDTGRLKRGASKPVKLTKAGTYAYVCAFHPYMKGAVVVSG